MIDRDHGCNLICGSVIGVGDNKKTLGMCSAQVPCMRFSTTEGKDVVGTGHWPMMARDLHEDQTVVEGLGGERS